LSWKCILRDDGQLADGYRLAASFIPNNVKASIPPCLVQTAHMKDTHQQQHSYLSSTPARSNMDSNIYCEHQSIMNEYNNNDNNTTSSLSATASAPSVDGDGDEKVLWSVQLGGGSVSKVRSGFLVVADNNNKTTKLGDNSFSDMSYDQKQQQQPVAIKFFKRNEEIWDHLSEQELLKYSLYPEVWLWYFSLSYSYFFSFSLSHSMVHIASTLLFLHSFFFCFFLLFTRAMHNYLHTIVCTTRSKYHPSIVTSSKHCALFRCISV
jgi:hypothetical protein